MELRRQTAFNTFHATGLPLKNLKSWQARRNRGSWWAAAPPPPRFLLNLTFYQLAIIVKRKKYQKTYKPLQIPQKQLVACSCLFQLMYKSNFDWHCIFHAAFFYLSPWPFWHCIFHAAFFYLSPWPFSHCIFHAAFFFIFHHDHFDITSFTPHFFIFHHDHYQFQKQSFIKPCIFNWSYKLWGFISFGS